MRRNALGFMIGILAVAAAHAYTPEKPPEIASTIKATTPVGDASVSKLWLDVYDSSVWTDAEKWSMEVPFALSLVYAMGFSQDDLLDRTISEMNRIEPLDEETSARYRSMLLKPYTDVAKKDRITALFQPPETVKFFHNGKPTGTITDAAFAKKFFAIWLSPASSEPSLFQQIMKANAEKQAAKGNKKQKQKKPKKIKIKDN